MNLLKETIRKAKEYDTLIESFKTPKFRKPTPPPAPNPNYTPPPSAKKTCTYETPCGWCTKWDKKCDKKIGGYLTVNPDDKTSKAPCFRCESYEYGDPKCPTCKKENYKYFETKRN